MKVLLVRLIAFCPVVFTSYATSKDSSEIPEVLRVEQLKSEVLKEFIAILSDLDEFRESQRLLRKYTKELTLIAYPSGELTDLSDELRILKKYREIQRQRYTPIMQELEDWVHSYNLGNRAYFLENSGLSEQDLDTLINMIEGKGPYVERRIFSINAKSSSEVEIHTGTLEGGLLFQFEKLDNIWVETNYLIWVQ